MIKIHLLKFRKSGSGKPQPGCRAMYTSKPKDMILLLGTMKKSSSKQKTHQEGNFFLAREINLLQEGLDRSYSSSIIRPLFRYPNIYTQIKENGLDGAQVVLSRMLSSQGLLSIILYSCPYLTGYSYVWGASIPYSPFCIFSFTNRSEQERILQIEHKPILLMQIISQRFREFDFQQLVPCNRDFREIPLYVPKGMQLYCLIKTLPPRRHQAFNTADASPTIV